ncbi:MAG: hypothetical protein ABW192_05855, partial [Sphingobium sp.]
PPPIADAAYAKAVGDAMRRFCMSEAGVRIVIADAVRNQSAAILTAQLMQGRAIDQELGDAAYADPLDIGRLERAKRARDAHLAARIAAGTDRSIGLIRQLSLADRRIYARRLSVMQPVTPDPLCAPPRADKAP